MKRLHRHFWILVTAVVLGCATGPHKWSSHPAVEHSSNPYYAVELEPVKEYGDYFTGFRLAFTNRTQSPIEIDWNRTFYHYDGANQGRFIFKGLDPRLVREARIPPDIVAPGQTMIKTISPVKWVGTGDVRPGSSEMGQKIAGFGQLPAGENGVYLFVRRNGQDIWGKIMVQLVSEKVK